MGEIRIVGPGKTRDIVIRYARKIFLSRRRLAEARPTIWQKTRYGVKSIPLHLPMN